MILVQNNWETVKDINDIVRIIREYYSEDLSKVLENIIWETNTNVITELEKECDSLESENHDLQGYVDELEDENEDLKQEIKKLEERISELESK